MELSSMLNCESKINNGISDRFLGSGHWISFFYGGQKRYNGAGSNAVLGPSACAFLDL